MITGAGDLPAEFVIHTVGPIWDDDRTEEHEQHDRTLASCYSRSLSLAAEHEVRSIAFPNISTGVYGFPKPRAAHVAVQATVDWLAAAGDHPIERIVFVCFDDENHSLYRALVED